MDQRTFNCFVIGCIVQYFVRMILFSTISISIPLSLVHSLSLSSILIIFRIFLSFFSDSLFER